MSEDQKLAYIFSRLSKIEEGAEIVQFLKNNNIRITLGSEAASEAATNYITINDIQGRSFIVEGKNCEIHISPGLDDGNIIQAIAHESQHIRHYLNNVGHPDKWLSSEDHCLVRRAQEADCQVKATRIAWQLEQISDLAPALAIMNTHYSPIYKAFNEACKKDKNAFNNGIADRAAYDAWFKVKSLKRYYDRDAERIMRPLLKLRLWENPDHEIKEGTLKESWLKKIGALSKINYMALPNTSSLLSKKYRKDIQKNITLNLK